MDVVRVVKWEALNGPGSSLEILTLFHSSLIYSVDVYPSGLGFGVTVQNQQARPFAPLRIRLVGKTHWIILCEHGKRFHRRSKGENCGSL